MRQVRKILKEQRETSLSAADSDEDTEVVIIKPKTSFAAVFGDDINEQEDEEDSNEVEVPEAAQSTTKPKKKKRSKSKSKSKSSSDLSASNASNSADSEQPEESQSGSLQHEVPYRSVVDMLLACDPKLFDADAEMRVHVFSPLFQFVWLCGCVRWLENVWRSCCAPVESS